MKGGFTWPAGRGRSCRRGTRPCGCRAGTWAAATGGTPMTGAAPEPRTGRFCNTSGGGQSTEPLRTEGLQSPAVGKTTDWLPPPPPQYGTHPQPIAQAPRKARGELCGRRRRKICGNYAGKYGKCGNYTVIFPGKKYLKNRPEVLDFLKQNSHNYLV